MYKNPINTKFNYDHKEEKVVLHNTQDIQPILDMNKMEMNGDSPYGVQNNPDLRKVASIPLIIIEKWKRELGVDIMDKNDMPKVKKLLNDPEYSWLRTHKSTI
jgi:hypothetical protein|tara:strand:+ start:63 stop:371 length:309 start_codon:yes stop_codon:yes gene_type:complete